MDKTDVAVGLREVAEKLLRNNTTAPCREPVVTLFTTNNVTLLPRTG
jgi:hypothetical protein